MPSCDALFEWLLDGAPGATNAPAIAQRIGDDLLAGGVPLDRFGVFVTTLFGEGENAHFFLWLPDERASEHVRMLKLIGDGLLAIFPITDEKNAKTQCVAALEAAAETFEAIANFPGLRIGLALHIGDVEYGNIGGASRLDFTAIGSAVNMAARLEGIASKLGRSMVLSADFARATERTFEDLGAFELKGISGPQRVFG